MPKGEQMATYLKNGKVQIQVAVPGKPKAKLRFADDKERGRIRKAIEDRKIAAELGIELEDME